MGYTAASPNVVGNLVTHPNNDTDKAQIHKNSFSLFQQYP
jgi:hypothetical protein